MGGAVLSAVLVAAAYLLPTPVGTTASRLPELFAAPVIVAVAAVPLVALIAATASIVLLLPPVSITEVQERGDPALGPLFYAPLLNELAARRAAGPIEVVPTQRRGEAAFVAATVPIAKAGRGQPTPDATPSSTTEPSTRTPTRNGSTITPSPMWPSLKGRRLVGS